MVKVTPVKITPAPSFGGRFAAKDLKEFYDEIGKFYDSIEERYDYIKTPEEFDNWMLAAWETYKNRKNAARVPDVLGMLGGLGDCRGRGERRVWGQVIYSVPDLDALDACMDEAQEKRIEAEEHPNDPAAATGKHAHSSPLPEFLENFIVNSPLQAWGSFVYDLALLRAVETGDIQVLRRGIEEKVRYSYVRDLLYLLPEDKPSFYVMGHLVFDHASWLGDVLNAYACGRPDLARRIFRKGVGLSIHETSGCFSLATNLCIAAMYEDADWKTQTLLAAAAYRKKTKAVYQRAFVDFFAAVLEQDAPWMSECLSVLAKSAPKLVWIRDRNNKRIFNCALHGMYAFAAAHLPEDVFRGVKRPEAAWWWDEYADLIEGIILSGIHPAPAGPLFPLSGEAAVLNNLLFVIDTPPLK